MADNLELNFTLIPQIPDKWCWAATSASIADFYNPGTFTPCTVASKCLNKECCPGTVPNPCNQVNTLEDAFRITGNLTGPVRNDSISIDDIMGEIRNQRVIAVGVRLNDGSGHFITIYGYHVDDNNEATLALADPARGKVQVKLDDLVFSYFGEGGWANTYFTKSSSAHQPQFAETSGNLLMQSALFMPELGEALMLSFPNPEPPEESTPVDIYLAPYAALQPGKRLRVRRYARRVLRRDTEGKPYIADYDHEIAEHTLKMVTGDAAYLNKYMEAGSQITRPKLKQRYILRLLAQPTLKVEAFWLHRPGDPRRDRFLPIHARNGFRTDRWYTRKTFFARLRKLASEKPAETALLTGG